MTSAVVDGERPPTVAPLPKLHYPPLLLLGGLWVWAIYALSGYWKDFEQYSYGYFVPALAGYFVWRRLALFASNHPSGTVTGSGPLVGWSILTALAILPLEYLRIALPGSRATVWLIALLTIAYSLVFALRMGGAPLARTVAFPILFFLSSAPWFSILENNVTLGLMQYVTVVVTEMLHVLGIQAKANGTLIAMAPGVVGIAEACSGIRSLQSGIMYSLAVGELFLLSTGRRVSLLVLTVLCGFILNLGRTFTLAYQTDKHGLQIIDKIHDQVGLITSLLLPVAVWGIGKLLAGREPEPSKEAERPLDWIKRRSIQMPGLALWSALALAAFLPCHLWLMVQDATIAKQTKPYFIPRLTDPLNTETKVQEDVWKALGPTSGGNVRRDDPTLPMAIGHGWHFFWEPNKDNFNILYHHPERCMAGAGWVPNGPMQEVEVNLNGKLVRWYAFPWKRDNDSAKMLQMWGAWRNGFPVIGISSFRTLEGILSQLRLFSKGNSATEIVSVSVPYKGDKLPLDELKAMAPQLFDYTGNSGK